MKQITLINNDCLIAMKELPDNSIDSVITDPPYGISFMSKKWDYDVPSTEIWKECLRVLKPGGHLLSFSGSRTYHRMAVRIEDAGFEIRDQIMWVYGSGFPKSHNIGKAIDKLKGNDREYLGENKNIAARSNLMLGERTDSGTIYSGVNKSIPITKGNSDWEGWGTALKPAHEPIVMARKPFNGSVAENVLKYGTGAINIDESRIATDDKLSRPINKANNIVYNNNYKTFGNEIEPIGGRFPANIIFDEEAGKILDEQSGKSKSALYDSKKYKSISVYKSGDIFGTSTKDLDKVGGYLDEGGASRFFYCPKEDDKDFIQPEGRFDEQSEELKPAHEPIVMARKPFNGSVAENVLKYGTGGINIDESRIGTDIITSKPGMKSSNFQGVSSKNDKDLTHSYEGRFPANIIFDEEAGKVLDEQSGELKSGGKKSNVKEYNKNRGEFVSNMGETYNSYEPNTGGASRFFYCPKANKKDRNEGCEDLEEKGYNINQAHNSKSLEERYDLKSKNNHPTVKPTKLMEYLIKLVTPKNGIVLDPFMGSGSTGKAAIKNNFNFIGIEREKDYFEIAKNRIQYENTLNYPIEIKQGEL